MRSNSTKILQDFLNLVAKEKGFKDFAYMIRNRSSNELNPFFMIMTEAAERYAEYKAEEAYRNGIAEGVSIASITLWGQACEAQKEECAAAYQKEREETGFGGIIDKSIILNAPSAINPHKKDD